MRTNAYRHITVNYQFGLSADMIGTNANPKTDRYYREIHFREPNRFPISRSRNQSVLSVLEYRPNGSTEPTETHNLYRPNANFGQHITPRVDQEASLGWNPT